MKYTQIPDELFSKFTQNNNIPVEYNYRDDSKQLDNQYNMNRFEELLNLAKSKQQLYYGDTDTWLYNAISKYPITNKDLLIFGSACPWYEAISISYDVKKCTVLEYCERNDFHPLIKYKKPENFTLDEKYEFGFSISSFEHDGLGRYGDPINPDGDLLAMKNAKKYIKKDGILFLSVPVGQDKICFNVHRIYGKKRLPLLLENWKVLDIFGGINNMYENNINNVSCTPYQPVYVLKNID